MTQVATLLLSQRLDATTGNLSGRIERFETVKPIPPMAKPTGESRTDNSTQAHASEQHRSDLPHLRNAERRTQQAKEGQTQQA